MIAMLTGIANLKNLIIAGVLAVLVGTAYFYYTNTQNRIEQLVAANAAWQESSKRLIDANNQNLQTIEQLEEYEREVRENYERVQNEFQIIRLQNKEFREKLAERNLSELAAERTETVEIIINEASNDALRCFELQSGAPFTEKERNSRSAIDANSECPWIFDGMFDE